MILEAAPASVAALLADGGLVRLPGVYVADCDFNNEGRIARIGCPLFMIQGLQDDFIVFERHVDAIWDNAVAPKESLWVDGAGHDDIPEVLGPTYHEAIGSFIQRWVLN